MRELVVLGTASQAPTRYRNHNGYFLRWDDEGILFDPGEGTQRQMLLAGVRASAITRICITHFHGDHCLGLPGVVQRLSLDQVKHPVELCFPAGGLVYAERLLEAAVFEHNADVRLRPVEDGMVEQSAGHRLRAERLDHGPATLGWRVEEPAGRSMVRERLESFGVRGPDVGRLQRDGSLAVPGRPEPVRLDQVSIERPGQVMAFVMDTGLCDGALALAEGADLLVCEATFAESERELARRFRHLTASQAGRLAAESGARRLVITHFSQRYSDTSVLVAEAGAHFGDVVGAQDLVTVPVPPRRILGEQRSSGPTGQPGSASWPAGVSPK